MDYLDRIYLWLGNTSNSQAEFENYFKLDYSEDISSRKICGFCQDIGVKWYDEDFIGYLKFDEELSIEEILQEAPIDSDEYEKILAKCDELGLRSANAVYWYSGEIEKPDSNKSYNDLLYIGEYSID